MNSEKIIEVKNLTVGYKDSTVLEDINFSVSEGEVFGILGGSGCGKSTILKHMIGLFKPLSGMCKRAALARAMALDPKILFFDEPSAGLDPISSADLDRLILHLKKTTNSKVKEFLTRSSLRL